jgi:hypothetical protein
MLLFLLLARHTKGIKPLVHYSQSHVVISSKYLDILRRKVMEKIVVEEIRKVNEKKRNKSKLKK